MAGRRQEKHTQKMRGFSVYSRKGRPHFYICFLSAETWDWKDEATNFRTDDPQGRKKALRVAEQKAAEYFAQQPGRSREAWAGWVPGWLTDHYNGKNMTLQRYQGVWAGLQTFLAERKIHRPAMLTYDVARTYIDWRTAQKRHCGKPISRNTAILEIKILGTIMREAVRRGYAFNNPCEKMGLLRDVPKPKQELSEDDIAAYRAALLAKEGHLPITDRWMTICFEIALHQGCRLMETSVPLSDVDMKRKTITFRAKGRNGEPHIFTTTLHPALIPLMKDLAAAKAERTCNLPRMAGKAWWSFRQENNLGHTTFHATRVTVVTRLARAGVPIQQAMRFVGHADETVHKIYQKLQADDLSSCTDALKF